MRSIPAAILAGLCLLAPLQDSPPNLRDLKKTLAESLAAADVDRADQAVRRIAELNTKQAVEFLITVGLRVDKYPGLDEHGKVRIFRAVLETLPEVTDEEARQYIFEEVLRLKRPRDESKQVFLTEIVGRMDGEDAETTLIELLSKARSDAVLIEAIEALGRGRSVRAVEPLIEILSERSDRKDLVWRAARMALISITGYDFEEDADWRNFWEGRKGRFDPTKDRGEAKPEGRSRERGVPSFFDEEVLARRLIFIIDTSKSMHIKDPPVGGEQPKAGPGGKGSDEACPICGDRHRGVGFPDARMRIERVKREMIRMIETLDTDVKFNILAFSTRVTAWNGADELLQATPKNKEKAIFFVRRMTFEEYTSTDRALERAFAHREANAIYLLSDGMPLRDGVSLPKDSILAKVALQNRTRKVKIFTFGFSKDADAEFLRKLAEENGGNFKAVR